MSSCKSDFSNSIDACSSFRKVSKDFVITIADNTWTNELTIKGWTYGQNANKPNAKATFGTVNYTYSESKDGTYTSTVPTKAGTYYAKAEVIGFFVKLFVAYKIVAIPVKNIIKQFLRSLICLLLAVSLGACMQLFLPNGNLYSFCSVVICFILAVLVVFVVVLSQSERKIIINKIINK